MKERLAALPLYHPTSTLLVDDNPRFLSTFRLQIRTRTPVHTYDSPVEALENLDRLVDIGHLRPGDAVQRLQESNRFDICSTLIVDFDMPEMTGLDLCMRLGNRPINRILLTGKADESHAVDAFNRGLIHRFVRKDDPDVGDRINRYLRELNQGYFRRLADPQIHTDEQDVLHLFYTRGLADVLDALYEEHRLVEHYFLEYPAGILLLDAKGRVWLLLLLSKEEKAVHQEIATSEGAPHELLSILKEGEQVPLFPSSDGYYRKDWEDNWQGYLHPGTALAGDTGATFTVLDEEAIPQGLKETLSEGKKTFADYRASRRKN